jgi:hypothetical protein
VIRGFERFDKGIFDFSTTVGFRERNMVETDVVLLLVWLLQLIVNHKKCVQC